MKHNSLIIIALCTILQLYASHIDNVKIIAGLIYAGTIDASNLEKVAEIIKHEYGPVRTLYDFTTIDSSGFYKLASNIVNEITITVPNVMLDLNGQTVSGGTNGIVINSGLSNVTIKNGTINNVNDGILINSGCTDITLLNVTSKNCLRGIYGTDIQDVVIRNCDLISNTTGVELEAVVNVCMENCIAQANIQAGYSLVSSSTCTLQDCKALATGEGNASIFGDTSNVFGFVSSNGYGNIFERCIANATQALTTTDSNSVVAGFGLKGTEGCSKIINCEAANSMTSPDGVTVPYGIWLEPQFDGLTTVTSVGNFDTINAVRWSPDGTYVAIGGLITSGNDLIVYRFDQISKNLIQVDSVNPDEGTDADTVMSLAWSPDGQYLAVGGTIFGTTNRDLFVYRFDRASERLVLIISLHPTGGTGTSIDSLAWTSDGLYLAVGGSISGGTNFDLFVYQFDRVAQTLTQIVAINPNGGTPNETVRSLSWSPDGEYLTMGDSATSGNTFFVFRFNRTVGTLTTVFSTNPDGGGIDTINSVQWHPNGNYIAVGGNIAGTTGNDLWIYRFNRATETATAVFSLNPDGGAIGDSVRTLNWSPDGNYLAVGGLIGDVTGNDLFVYKFDVSSETLAVVAAINPDEGAGDTVISLQWAPDGQYLAVGGSLADMTGNDLFIYTGLRFPEKNVITNNTVYCNSGNKYPTGAGISGSSIANLIIGNVAYADPLNSVVSSNNYQFVCNVFNPLFDDAPTELQNIALGSNQPIPSRYDIPSALNRLEVLAESLVDNLL